MRRIVTILIIFTISVAFIGLFDGVYAKGGGGGGKGGSGSKSSSSANEKVYSPTALPPASSGSPNSVNTANTLGNQKNFYNIAFLGMVSFIVLFLWFVLKKRK